MLVLVLLTTVVLLTGTAALLRWRRHHRAADLILLCASLTMSLYLAEGAARLLDQPTGFWQARLQGQSFDTQSRLSRIDELRADGIAAFPQVIPAAFVATDGIRYGQQTLGRLLPLAGLSRTPTVFCNESGEWLVYTSDEHGFRNPPGLHGADRMDVVLVGDSFTHGQCVSDSENVAGRLRARGLATLNLGISGTGPLMSLASFVEFAQPVRPKVVVWLFFDGNDLRDLDRERHSSILRAYLRDDTTQRLRRRQQEVDHRLKSYLSFHLGNGRKAEEERIEDEKSRRSLQSFLRLGHLEELATNLGRLPYMGPPATGFPGHTPEAQDVRPLLLRILEIARRRAQAWDGEIVFVYLSRGQGALDDATRQDLLERVAGLGIRTVNFHQVLEQHPDPLSLFPLRRRLHYNARGYGLLADTVLDALEEVPRLARTLDRDSSTPLGDPSAGAP